MADSLLLSITRLRLLPQPRRQTVACCTLGCFELTHVPQSPALHPSAWQRPNAIPQLPLNTIHVWRLLPGGMKTAEDSMLLYPEEQTRAGSYRVAADAEQFRETRAALRLLLAHYGGYPSAGRVPLCYTAAGKPYVAGGSLRCNVAHTDGAAVIALAHEIDVGVDAERVRPADDLADVAQQHFAAEEMAALASLPPAQWTAAFYRCWTRKEALLKAQGLGLTGALKSFPVSLDADEPARLLHKGSPGSGHAEWELAHLDITPEVMGALAWPSTPTLLTIEHYDFVPALFADKR